MLFCRRFYPVAKHWKQFRKALHNFQTSNGSASCLLCKVPFWKSMQSLINNNAYLKLGFVPFIFATFSPVLTVHSAELLPPNHSDKQRDKEIIRLLNQAKMLLSKGQYEKAELSYNAALHLALKKDNPTLIAYIQDLIANLALQTNQLDKAEPLYKNILHNLISNGRAQNDPVVIEISLKLASVYARLGKKEFAVTGYRWCSDTCRKSIKEVKATNVDNEGLVNMKVLLGMILDSYGRYLHDINDNKTALAVTSEALNISLDVFGESHERTVVLYTDLSSIAIELGDYNGAYEYLQKAMAIAKSNPKLVGPSENALFFTNLAYIYIKQGKQKEAEDAYKQALLEASKSNDKVVQSHVAAMVHVFPKKKE